MISTLRKSGNSIVVSIPREELERVGVQIGEQVSVEIRPLDIRPRLAADLREAAKIELERSHDALDYLAR
jgi:antitoxin component of MazEF toxin-antitoxin module